MRIIHLIFDILVLGCYSFVVIIIRRVQNCSNKIPELRERVILGGARTFLTLGDCKCMKGFASESD